MAFAAARCHGLPTAAQRRRCQTRGVAEPGPWLWQGSPGQPGLGLAVGLWLLAPSIPLGFWTCCKPQQQQTHSLSRGCWWRGRGVGPQLAPDPRCHPSGKLPCDSGPGIPPFETRESLCISPSPPLSLSPQHRTEPPLGLSWLPEVKFKEEKQLISLPRFCLNRAEPQQQPCSLLSRRSVSSNSSSLQPAGNPALCDHSPLGGVAPARCKPEPHRSCSQTCPSVFKRLCQAVSCA